METEKIIKNSDKPVRVRCEKCNLEFPLYENMRERDVEDGKKDLIEAYFTCPHCQYRKHLYFLSPQTARIRYNLRIAIENFKRNRSRQNWHLVTIVRKSHQQAYDDDQQKYSHLIEELDASAQP